jgi:hypothetical protein
MKHYFFYSKNQKKINKHLFDLPMNKTQLSCRKNRKIIMCNRNVSTPFLFVIPIDFTVSKTVHYFETINYLIEISRVQPRLLNNEFVSHQLTEVVKKKYSVG